MEIINRIQYRLMVDRLHVCDKHVVLSLMKIYKQLDREIEQFKHASQISCLSGCGQCCDSPQVEATVLEVFALAVELYRLKERGLFDERELFDSQKESCTFYVPDSKISGNGRCAVYRFRPLMCRLFGFSARKDKQGNPVFSTCAKIRAHDPEHCAKVQRVLNRGASVPLMGDYSMRIYNLDSYFTRERFLIMVAVRYAFERVEFLFNYRPRNRKKSFLLLDA